MGLDSVVNREPMRPGEERLPWDDDVFSRRMLRQHLDPTHDRASRRPSLVDRHVSWLRHLLPAEPARVLDLGCGPGLYLERFATAGSDCLGVDIAPAAIDYARDRATELRLSARYRRLDIRALDLDGERFDLVLLLFGELNTFEPSEAMAVLQGAAGALGAEGRLVVELSTLAGVRALSTTTSNWYTAREGLFADSDHVVLREAAWFEAEHATVERYWVVADPDGEVQRFGVTTWWHDSVLHQALERAGLTVTARYRDLTGRAPGDEHELEVLVLAPARSA